MAPFIFYGITKVYFKYCYLNDRSWNTKLYIGCIHRMGSYKV